MGKQSEEQKEIAEFMQKLLQFLCDVKGHYRYLDHRNSTVEDINCLVEIIRAIVIYTEPSYASKKKINSLLMNMRVSQLEE